MGSGLVDLHMKVTLLGKSFAISKNWLNLRGAISPQIVGSRCQSTKNAENKKI